MPVMHARGQEHEVGKSILAGALGGLAAAWTMNKFQSALSRLSKPAEGSAVEMRESHGDDATVKAASAISVSTTGHHLTGREKQIAGPIVHYAFGSAMGALYGVAAELMPVTTTGWGLPFGAAVWLGADEVGVPAARLSPSPGEVPISTHASALMAHLVYGAAVDTVRRIVRAVLD